MYEGAAALAPYMIQAFGDLGSAYAQGEALKAQGKYKKTIGDINQRLYNAQAEDAIRRGEKEADRFRKQASQVRGAQKAALAASGVDIAYGSAADLQAQTYEMSELDAMTIRNNAFKEAWGYRMQGSQAASEGRMAALSANFDARNTLLTGGMRALSSGWQGYNAYKKYSLENPPSKIADTSNDDQE